MPDATPPFDAAHVRALLAHTRFGDVRYVAETGSTNTDVQPLLGDPSARGSTLVAGYQRAGVGRKGRPWVAPPGSSLLFTTLLPEPVATDALWAVPFWAALAVAAAVEQSAGVRLDLVWPNDLFVRGRKAGGILSVARIAGDDAWAGCGIGLNVVRPAHDAALEALPLPPIFLDELAPAVSRERTLAAILAAFDATLAHLARPLAVARAWEERAALRGTPYRYRRDDDGIEREGTAVRLGPHGTLVVDDGEGERAVDMADVRAMRG